MRRQMGWCCPLVGGRLLVRREGCSYLLSSGIVCASCGQPPVSGDVRFRRLQRVVLDRNGRSG